MPKAALTGPCVVYGPQAASPMTCWFAVMSFDVLALLGIHFTNPVYHLLLFLGILPPASDQKVKEKRSE